MRVIRLSPLARADLEAIWDHTAMRWDEAHAESYLQGLDASMKLLAANPRLGRVIDDIREGYLKFPAASHILIYRLKPGAIEFIRTLHKSSDVERHV